jgi:hypothetical protein
VYTGGSSTTKAIVTLKRKTTLEVIASKDFDLVGSTLFSTRKRQFIYR